MNKIFQRMGEETPPVQKTAKQLEKEAKKAAEKAAKLEKLAAKQAKQVSHSLGWIFSLWNIDVLRDNWEAGLSGDPAHVVPGPGHPHVAPLPPVLPPAVLQDPEVLPSLLF